MCIINFSSLIIDDSGQFAFNHTDIKICLYSPLMVIYKTSYELYGQMTFIGANMGQIFYVFKVHWHMTKCGTICSRHTGTVLKYS